MEQLSQALKGFKLTLMLIAGFSLFAALLQLTIPLYMLQIYDRVLPSQSTDTLIFLSILAAFALIILGLTEMVRHILGTRAAAKLDTVLAGDVMEKVIQLGHKSNGNTQPVRDLQSIRSMISSKVMFGVIDIPFSIVFIACLYFVHPTLFWLTIVGAAILFAVALANVKMTQKATKAQAKANMIANQQSEHFARNADSILAMGMLKDVVGLWGRSNANVLIATDQSANLNSFFGGLSRIIRFGIQATMLGLGAFLVQQGQMTAGMIFASSIISGRALQPIDVVINSWPQISAGRESWNRLKEFLDSNPIRKSYTSLEEPKGELTVENVLQPNALDAKKPPLLARVSFKLEAGKSVAVVGPSGSGKSTLGRILVGAMKPFAGDVRLDGHDMANWDPQDLGKYIGFLAQDVELLPGTIAQNISRFRSDATPEAVQKAATMAHVQDLIKKLPHGYDTMIGPGGISISGGEKQRIALARAFYGDPKLLVLDEPNSSLDRLGETALLRALIAAKRNHMTVFLITQRESVIQVVDRIMRFKDGKIVDYDDRDVVLKKFAEKANKQPLEKLKKKTKKAATKQTAVKQPTTETTTPKKSSLKVVKNQKLSA